MPTPQWATALLSRVAADHGRKAPELRWRRAGKRWPGRRPQGSSGHWNAAERRIVVTAGTSRVDQRIVLLHEAAHWLAPPKSAHNDTYWIIAFQLFRRYKVPMKYTRAKELRYRKGAIVGIIADREAQRARRGTT